MNESNHMKAQEVVLTAEVAIKRAATGAVEKYTLTGTAATPAAQPEAQPEAQQKEPE